MQGTPARAVAELVFVFVDGVRGTRWGRSIARRRRPSPGRSLAPRPPIICNGSHPPPSCNGPHPLPHLQRTSYSASIAPKDHRSSRTNCMTRRLAQPSVYAHLPILLACRSIQHAMPPGLRRHSVMPLTPPEPEGYHQGMNFHHFRLLTRKFVTTSHYSHAPLTQALWRPNLDNRNPVSTTVSIVPSEKSASRWRKLYKHRHPTGSAGLHRLY